MDEGSDDEARVIPCDGDRDCNCDKCEEAERRARQMNITLSSDDEDQDEHSSSGSLDMEPMPYEYTPQNRDRVRWTPQEMEQMLWEDPDEEPDHALRAHNNWRRTQGRLPVPWVQDPSQKKEE